MFLFMHRMCGAQATLMYHMSETQVELMHRIADAQADAYVPHR